MNQLIGLGQAVVRLFNRFAVALLAVLTLATVASGQQFVIGAYHQQSAVRVTTTQYDYTYTADVTNNGAAASGVVGTVTSSSPNTLVMKGTTNFGSVGASGTTTSTDTFVIRQDRRFTFDPSSLSWLFTSAQPPTANAGPNQTAHIGDTVTLNGTGSTDPNGKPLTYLWTIFSAPSGSSATINSPTAPMPTLKVDVAGNYVIHLVVNNGTLNSSPSSVTISTSHTAPTAHAGPNQTGAVGTLIQLDGSASVDPDGNSLTYAWTIFSAPAGSTATLSSATAVKPSFTIDKFGTYVLQLVVSDQFLSSTPSQVTITTTHTLPVANAGPSQSATVGSTVTLDGSLSSDVDGFPLTYSWSLTSVPKGSNAVLSLATTAHPNFLLDVAGTYVAQLIVNDGFNSSSPATVTISTEILAPVANAGPNQIAQLQQLVHLDGTGSTDPNNLSLTYLWSFLFRPAGSAASLSSTTAPQPTFTPDVHGTYVVQLVVNNGTFSSNPATVSIDVPAPTPVANAGANQTIAVGSTVSLTGLASSDSEGNPLTYAWSFTSTPGTAPTLNGATTATPSFIPSVAGNYVVQLVVNNGFNSSAPATVQITAVTPSASVPASLTFSDQAIGTSSASKPVTFTNTGAAPISISSVGATGDFSNQLVSGCGSTVAVGGNCSISVVFSPTAIGPRTGTLSIFDNVPGSPQTVSLSGNGVAGAASKVAFGVQPSTVAVGSSISPAVTVTIEDAGGNVVTTATNAVTIAIGANPGTGTLAGTATVNAVAGVATFSNLSVSSVGTGYTLAASGAGLTGASSNPFNVTAGAASKLVFSVQPSTAAVGSSISPAVTVTVEDAGGNVVTTATNAVTIAIGTNPGSGTLGGTATVNAVAGVATFSNLSVSSVGTGYTLAASSVGLTSAVSNVFNVTAGAAAKLVFGVQPSTVAVGSSMSPAVTVTVEDAGGNVVTTATNAVTIGIGTNPGSGTLGGTATVNAVAGVATFSNLSVSSVGTGYTLAASSVGLTSAVSNVFNVTAGAAAKLVFGVQPSTVAVGSSISPAVTVTVEDAGGNVVTGATNAVTIAIGANPGTGTLAGTATVNAVAGVATFSNLSVSSVGSGYTLAASSAGLTGTTSNPFNVTAGAASKLVFGVQPSTVTVGSSIAPAVTVTVEDAGGNVVTGATNAVTIAIGANPGSGTLGGTATVNAVNGVATFSNLSVSSVGTSYTLVASSAGLTSAVSNVFNVTAGAAAKLVFGVQPSTVAVGSSIAPAVTVKIEDAGGNLVAGATNAVTIAIGTNPASGTLGGTVTVNAVAGVATFSNLSIGSVGTGYTLSASSAGLTGATSNTFNVTAGAAAKLVFGVQPSTVTVGSSISPAVTVTVEDAGGNVVTNATNAVTIAIGTNPGSGTLGGTATVNAINGVATFSNLSVSSVGTGYTLAASSAGLTSAVSNAFNVTAGTAAKLVFGVQPSTVAVGSTIAPAVTVTIEDAGGNVVTGATNTVTIAIGTNPGSGTLGGTATVNAVNGVATFSNLSLSSVGSGYTLAASSAGLMGTTSNLFNVTAGAAAKLVFGVQPSTVAVGSSIAVTVKIEDAGGNFVTGATNAVTIAIGTNPGSGTLGGTVTVNAVAGVATFSNLSIGSVGTGYTLAASATGLTGTTSDPFNVTAGAAAKLVFSVQPSTVAVGLSISPAVTVTVEDAGGNVVTTATNAVTIAIGTNPGSGALGGTATVNAVAGVATFSNLSINNVGTGYTLVASSTGLTGVSSNPFNVTAGPASKLVVSVQPPNTVAVGSPISLAVTVEDAGGNVVTTATNAVTIAIGTNPGSGTLSGVVTVNAVNGVATFSNLSINNVGTGYTLVASSTGLTGVSSNPFNVTAGPASKVMFGVQPSNTLAGASITPAVTVIVEDAGGNTVTSATNTVTLAIATNPASGTLSGTLTAVAVNGVASFAGLNINQVGTGYTLSASTAGLTSAVSSPFNVTGIQITVTVPSSLVGNGSSLSGSFTLAQAAPAGGVVVTLSSSNTAAVTISPATVSLLQGQTTGTFTYNGVTSGMATLSASAPGYITGTTTVTATSQVISLGAVSNITVGQTVSLPLSLGTVAPAGGLTVNLTSSNPASATITSSVFIPAGSQIPSANPQMTALAPGSTQISATASGFAPNSESVTVIAPTAALSPSPVAAHQTLVSAVTLTISAPAGGTTFTLTTDNAAIATVQSPVTIAQGSTSTTVNVTGVGIGSTTLRADSTGIVEATDTVNVTAEPVINFANQSVGNNMVAAPSASLSAAPSSNETITFTSNDITHFLLSTSQSVVGSPSITLPLTAGSQNIPQFFIQGQNLPGSTSLTGMITASAPGYTTATVTYTLLPTGLYLSSATASTTTFSANMAIGVNLAILTSGTLSFSGPGTLGPQAAPISVSLVNGTPAVGTVLGSPATIAIGASSTGSQLSFKPLTAGTTNLTLTQPAGYNVVGNQAQQVVVTVTAPVINFANQSVGNNMVAAPSASLSAPPPSNETLTLTSNDQNHFLLSTSQSTVGSASITLPLTAGSQNIPQFFIQGQNLPGSTSLTAMITASAPGYTSATVTYTLLPTGLYLSAATASTTTFSANTAIGVNLAILNSGTLSISGFSGILGPQAAPISVSLVNGTPAVGTVLGSPATIAIGASSTGSQLSFKPLTAGTTNLTLTQPSGYNVPSNEPQLTAVTVSAPVINFANQSVGNNMVAAPSASLSAPPPSNETLTLTSNDQNHFLLSTSQSTVGSASITLPLTAGSQNIPQFFIQGQNLPGSTSLTAMITASAPGYTSATVTYTLLPTGLYLSAATASTTTFSANTAIGVNLAILNSGTLSISGFSGILGPQAAPISVSLVNGTPAVGTVLGSPATIAIGASSTGSQLSFKPLTAGTTNLTLTQPSGYNVPSNEPQLTAVTVSAPVINFANQSVGNNMVAAPSASLSAPPPSNETLTLTSNDQNHFLLSTSQSTVGSASITLPLTEGSQNIPQFFIQGQNLPGSTSLTAMITASAPGYTNATVTYTLLPTGLYLNTSAITTTTSSANTSVIVEVAILNSASLTFSGFSGTLGPQAGPLSISLGNSNTAVGTVVGSPATIAIGATSTSNELSFKPLTAGTTTLTLTQPSGFNVVNGQPQQIAVTVTP